jgi:hypothetical protein
VNLKINKLLMFRINYGDCDINNSIVINLE